MKCHSAAYSAVTRQPGVQHKQRFHTADLRWHMRPPHAQNAEHADGYSNTDPVVVRVIRQRGCYGSLTSLTSQNAATPAREAATSPQRCQVLSETHNA